MAWIETADPEGAGDEGTDEGAHDELRELFAMARDPVSGRVDHILAIHSLHPAGMRAHFDLYRTVMTGTASLPKVEREMIALHVSRLNSCHY